MAFRTNQSIKQQAQTMAQAMANPTPKVTGNYGNQTAQTSGFITIPNNSSTTAITTSGLGTISTISTTGTLTIASDVLDVNQFYMDTRFDLDGKKWCFKEGNGTIELPDGSIIEIDDAGNFIVKDKKRKTKFFRKNYQLREGQILFMPDGTRLIMEAGGFKIEDANAKVIYAANEKRQFNPYVNASEILGDFVGDLGKVGVIQSNVLNTPIEYFINWLIHRAAEKDDDPYASKGVPTLIESKPLLPMKTTSPKCKCCGRFISAKRSKLGINFCNALHMEKFEIKMGVAA